MINTHTQMLYINGLERTDLGWPERLLAWLFGRKRVDLHFAGVDWHGQSDIADLRSKVVAQAKEIVTKSNQLTLVGVSAGASLALSVFIELRRELLNADLRLVCISGRLQQGDRNHLIHTALHRKGKKPSIAYLHSVVDCDEQFVPRLTAEDKMFVKAYRPLYDRTVPVNTMGIDGVEQHRILAIGHMFGIVMGLLKLLSYPKDSYTILARDEGVR